jgi:hypothetical protein
MLSSCSKGTDFVDNNAFPVGWASVDTFTLNTQNVKDTLPLIANILFCPLGADLSSDYGLTLTGFYANYETTTSSQSFSFSSIDSTVLIVPYYTTNTYNTNGPADKPYNIAVYELTEALDINTANTPKDYSYTPTPIGSLSNYYLNLTDSLYDDTLKIPASLRVRLSDAFGNKLIAPGSYADLTSFRNVFKGVYLKVNNSSSTNGFAFLVLNSSNRIKIYGKNSSGARISSEFNLGSNSLSINSYKNDQNSKAALAALNSKITGDETLFLSGVGGNFAKLQLPTSIKNFAKSYDIFKAELQFYVLDTGYRLTSKLGITLDSNLYRVINDEYISSSYRYAPTDTLIGGKNYKVLKYNIGSFVNSFISSNSGNGTLNISACPNVFLTSGTIRSSIYYPTRLTLGGSASNLKPKLKLFYIPK